MSSQSSPASSPVFAASVTRAHSAPRAPLSIQARLLQPDHGDRRRFMRRGMVLGVAALAAGLVDEGVAWRRLVADYRTEVGAQRHVRLDDRTQLLLNTRTAVDVSELDEVLEIRLLTGEVLLDQRAGAARLTIIHTSQGQVSTQGGRLVVRRQASETAVDALAGAAQVLPAHRSAQQSRVEQGQHLIFSRQHVSPPSAIQHDRIAWVDGLIIARDMKLADFVEELQRYSSARLQCDPSVASLLVSGNFPITDLKRVFAWLTTTLPLRVEEQGTQWGRQALTIRALG